MSSRKYPRSSLYVHVPFCRQKCAYCDFYSVVATDDLLVAAYLEALSKEAARADLDEPVTVYIGGGTPTALPSDALAQLLVTLQQHFNLLTAREFTVEINPGTLSELDAETLLAAGVNRASLGVQSLNINTLKLLGRIHGPQESRDAVGLLRRSGIKNLSLDLIFAVPGQSLGDCRRDLEEVLSLEPEHLSAYGLSIPAGTPLAARVAAGEIRPLADAHYADMVALVHETLTGAGFEHYEISNFARPGRRCEHNMATWRNEYYVGLGPAAASYADGRRWRNVADLSEYVTRLGSGGNAIAMGEELSPEDRARETAMLALRTSDGLDVAAFRHRTGFDPLKLFSEAIAVHVAAGLLEVASSPTAALRLTPKALPVADAVLADFVA
jgi:putative oxygen-independent coproporphyrinogen III oxidase